jgi:hypothetical protein
MKRQTPAAVNETLRSSAEIAEEIAGRKRELTDCATRRDSAAAAQNRSAFEGLASECDRISREILFLEPQQRVAEAREKAEAEAEMQRQRERNAALDVDDFRAIEAAAEAFDDGLRKAALAIRSIRVIGERMQGRDAYSTAAMQAMRFFRNDVYIRAAASAGLAETFGFSHVLMTHRSDLSDIARAAASAATQVKE